MTTVTVVNEPVQVTVSGGRGPKGDPGSGGNISVNDLPTLFLALNDDGTDQAPIINAALSDPNFSKIVLPAGRFAFSIIVPQADKTLEGQGSDVTILERIGYTLPLTQATSCFKSSGVKKNVTLKGFTIDGNMAGQGGVGDSSRCHGIAGVYPNFNCEDVLVDDLTGYAWFIQGSVADPIDARIHNCRHYNAHMGFEWVGPTDRIIIDNCGGSSSSRNGNPPVSSVNVAHLHSYDGGGNASIKGYRGEGMAYGVLPLLDTANIDGWTLVDCEFTGQSTAPLYVDRTGSYSMTNLNIFGGKYIAAPTANGGAAAVFVTCTGKVVGAEFDGPGSGITLNTGTDMRFIGCEARGYTNSAGSGAAYGIYSNGGTATWDGGTLIAEGPPGAEFAATANINVSETTRREPAFAGRQELLYSLVGQTVLTQDGANTAFALIGLPSAYLDAAKIVLTGGVRRAAGDAYPGALTWSYAFADASTIRVRVVMGEANAAADYRFSFYVAEYA